MVDVVVLGQRLELRVSEVFSNPTGSVGSVKVKTVYSPSVPPHTPLLLLMEHRAHPTPAPISENYNGEHTTRVLRAEGRSTAALATTHQESVRHQGAPGFRGLRPLPPT